MNELFIECCIYFSGYTEQSRNFTVYKGFGNSSDGQHFLYHNNATSGHKFIIALDPPVVLQRLEVTNQIVLTICELKLIESSKLIFYVLCSLVPFQNLFIIMKKHYQHPN